MSQSSPMVVDNTDYAALAADEQPTLYARPEQLQALQNLYMDKNAQYEWMRARNKQLAANYDSLRRVARSTKEQNTKLEAKVGKLERKVARLRTAIHNVRVAKLGPLQLALDSMQQEAMLSEESE